MTRRLSRFILAALMTVWATSSFAQSSTLVQQSATSLQACSTTNATAAVNTQATLTLTPPAGQFVYLCGLDIAVSQNGTSTANTNLTFTSTNIGGWLWKYSLAATANLSLTQSFYFATPVKSAAAGTAVTIVSPSALTNTAFSINGYWYFAP